MKNKKSLIITFFITIIVSNLFFMPLKYHAIIISDEEVIKSMDLNDYEKKDHLQKMSSNTFLQKLKEYFFNIPEIKEWGLFLGILLIIIIIIINSEISHLWDKITGRNSADKPKEGKLANYIYIENVNTLIIENSKDFEIANVRGYKYNHSRNKALYDVDFEIIYDIPTPINQILPNYLMKEKILVCKIDDEVYIVATGGEMSSTGHGIEIKKILLDKSDRKEMLRVITKFTDPKQSNVERVLVCPYNVVKTNLKELPKKVILNK